MDKNFKRRWIRALLSGKYKQGRGLLKTRYGNFCCLGVACDLLDPNGWRNLEHELGVGVNGIVLSTPALKQIGLSKENQTTLIELNDKKSSSFVKIAAWIRVNL